MDEMDYIWLTITVIIGYIIYRIIEKLIDQNKNLQRTLSRIENMMYEHSLSTEAAQLENQENEITEDNISASKGEETKEESDESIQEWQKGIDQDIVNRFAKAKNPEEKINIQQEFLVDCLKQIKTQPEIFNDGDVKVDFQGETFLFNCHGALITVFDPVWHSVELDSPMLNIVRTAINYANTESIFTGVFYTNPENRNEILISSKAVIPFTPGIPAPIELVEFIFKNSFLYKRGFMEKIEELKKEKYNISPLLYNPGSVTHTNSN